MTKKAEEQGEASYNLRKRKTPEFEDDSGDEDYETTPKRKTPQKKKTKTESDGLGVGDEAPKFTGNNHDGSKVALTDHLAKGPVVVFFFDANSEDKTQKEVAGFKESHEEFKKYNTTLIGISADSAESQKEFATKEAVPFYLISDPELEIVKQFKAEGGKNKAKRVTYLIKDGKVAKAFKSVRVETHAKSVLKEVEPPKEKTPRKKAEKKPESKDEAE
jgi:peroxiredoxin Q/BCP